VNLSVLSHPVVYFSTGSGSIQLMPFPGAINLSFPAPSAALTLSAQMFVTDSSSPDGIRLSQGSQAQIFPDLVTAGGTQVVLGDDSSIALALGFAYTFAGTSYTELHVGSNGFITFGAGDTDFSPSVPEFLSGPPRIAPLWTDLDPTYGGTVTFGSNTYGLWEVRFQSIPPYNIMTTNTFSVLASSSALCFDYGFIGSVDGLAGVSQGNNLGAGLPVDLSAMGVLSFGSTMNPYEDFSGGTNDLSGTNFVLTLDGSGYPIQFY
jgi:hypothetical protein